LEDQTETLKQMAKGALVKFKISKTTVGPSTVFKTSQGLRRDTVKVPENKIRSGKIMITFLQMLQSMSH
jgi:hypothetical protein